MTYKQQYKELFDSAGTEYIAPFLKAWMSFNNWYRNELGDKVKDSDAMQECKKYGPVQSNFFRCFKDTSDKGVAFDMALWGLVRDIRNVSLRHPREKNKFVGYRDNLIYSDSDVQDNEEDEYGRDSNDFIPISSHRRGFYIQSYELEEFFVDTLEIIYQVRCNLVHGDFDVNNRYFLNLVENSYKVLYLTLEEMFK